MLQICLCGAYEGQLPASKRLFFTMFGACELRRPSLARRLIEAQGAEASKGRRPRCAVITVCGATEIKVPTLAEEFIDLQEAVRSGVLSMDSLEQYAGHLGSTDSDSVFSLTLFGAFEEANLPSEDEEVDGLAIQRHLGNISDSAASVLQMGVGQNDSHRRAILRQAVAVEKSHPAVA
ncbi:MAG: hypothetical protein ACE5GE_06275 [Phycisphaerae bacterium]